MSVGIAGYYTKETCFAGKPANHDSSVVQVIVEEEKEEGRACFPPYSPIISQPFPPLQSLRPPLTTPHFPQNLNEIEQIVRSKPKYKGRDLKTLPWNVKEMKTTLRDAEAKGNLIWLRNEEGKADYSYLYWYLQAQIDCSLGNVHVLVGNEHPVAKQLVFLNELISNVRSITHLGLEAFNRGDVHFEEENIPFMLKQSNYWPVLYLHDTQLFIDYFLETGDPKALDFLRGFMEDRFRYPSETIFRTYLETFRLAREKGLDVLANDLSKFRLDHHLLKFTNDVSYEAAVREKMTVGWVAERMSSYRKEVICYFWGSSHVEKKALPQWIKHSDPEATVISIVLNGGAYNKNRSFDVALKELGWVDKPFMLFLDSYREANFVIHIPNEGRELDPSYSFLRHPLVPFVE